MTAPLEIWGGVECSVVRVGTTTRNQLADTGHLFRASDLELLADLGLRTVRYPVLWEMIQPHPGACDWSWTDHRLDRLRELGITPIAGLIHHGSGPAWTHILDPDLPDLLADFAAKVARRYPWLTLFTPINEPLTTARISGLYGLWHPHGTDEATCFRLAVAECLAIARAMRAIREVTPSAQLVQTEDVGRIFSTPPLSDQASYENERRWLALDLLVGRVDEHHPFFARLLAAGVDKSSLAELSDRPCMPDIIGIDYYLTSDRMLDHRTDLHPGEPVGGNGRQSYVDIAAVRSDACRSECGLLPRLLEVWERYGRPISVTELHNGCTRDEQLRWLADGREAALCARAMGADVRAVTSWSLFGSVDWNSMLVRQDGYYEPGAFDVRASPPRPTVVAQAIRKWGSGQEFDHPALDASGWWNGEGTAGRLRPIALIGFNRFVSVLEECCGIRRLPTVPVGVDGADALCRERNAWVTVEIGLPPLSGGQPLQANCRYPDGSSLSVILPFREPHWRGAANALLDLLVDGATGHLRLAHAEENNQYVLLSRGVADSHSIGELAEG